MDSKTPCATCGKGTGLFKCQGCAQSFCTKHVNEHRQTLHHQLDDIILQHDTLHEIIIEKKYHHHPLVDCINEWEEKSIRKIQHIAKDIREQLTQLINTNQKTIVEEFNLLKQRIKTAREEDDFFESDLNKWISTLVRLKNELNNVSLSKTVKENQSIPLIYSLQLVAISIECRDENTSKQSQGGSTMITSDDIFERCLQGGVIDDHGRLILHNKVHSGIEFRGKVGYSFGTHRVRLQIETSSMGTWIFFGIISQSELMTTISYESASAYGWADYNDFFLAGIRQNNQTTGRFAHTREKDIISLIFDCTNRKISYTNERSECNQQLDIDINKCPFPWQLHVNLFGEGDRVRLRSAVSSL